MSPASPKSGVYFRVKSYLAKAGKQVSGSWGKVCGTRECADKTVQQYLKAHPKLNWTKERDRDVWIGTGEESSKYRGAYDVIEIKES